MQISLAMFTTHQMRILAVNLPTQKAANLKSFQKVTECNTSYNAKRCLVYQMGMNPPSDIKSGAIFCKLKDSGFVLMLGKCMRIDLSEAIMAGVHPSKYFYLLDQY